METVEISRLSGAGGLFALALLELSLNALNRLEVQLLGRNLGGGFGLPLV